MWKVQKKPQTNQKAEQLLNAAPHKRLILQSNWGVPCLVFSSKQLLMIFQKGHSFKRKQLKIWAQLKKNPKTIPAPETVQSSAEQEPSRQNTLDTMPPLHSTVHLSDSTSEVVICTLPHILTKCSLNQNMRTQVTRQQSKMFKDVKEYLETTSKPKNAYKA